MSRANALYTALKQYGRHEIDNAGFLKVWNDPELTEIYRGEVFRYNSSTYERVMQVRINLMSSMNVTWARPKITLAPIEARWLPWMAGMLLQLEEGWDFVPQFIKGYTWEPWVIWAWTAYVMDKQLSTSDQRHKLRELGLPINGELKRCHLTGTLLPVATLGSYFIEGETQLAIDLGSIPMQAQSIHPIKSKWKQYSNILEIATSPRRELIVINLGYFPSEHPQITVKVTSQGNYTLPLIPTIQRHFPHLCPSCNHHVQSCYWKEDSCIWCLETKYPNSVVKNYSENALSHVKVQVSIKKPFIMPEHPVRWLTPILLGCELEYNCNENRSLDTRLSLLKHLNDFVIFKHDGTLTAGGFEIVTAPADLPTHKAKFQPVFAAFPQALEVASNTGMHIHLDRNALSPLMLGRMVDFMHNPDNKGFIQAVGERAFNTYSAQHGLGYQTVLGRQSAGPRYSTLNLCPSATVEFRIFKTPETYPQFVKNLEFVVALLQYFRTGYTSIVPKEGRKYERFLEYLRKENHSKLEARNPSHYLVEYLKEKGVL